MKTFKCKLAVPTTITGVSLVFSTEFVLAETKKEAEEKAKIIFDDLLKRMVSESKIVCEKCEFCL